LDGVEWLYWRVTSTRDDGFIFGFSDFASNMAVQFASQILPIDRSEPEASFGMTWVSLAKGGI